MKSFDQAVAWLYSLEKARGIDLKLERVHDALHAVGDPHRRLRCIHVAGTNGKGSVVAYLAAMLGAADLRAGMYTSPHLIDVTERIQVNGQPIAARAFAALAGEVRSRVTDRGIGLTFFEVLTVMAFLQFVREGVDCAVVEVGLGGRLDATNVIDPLVSVVTSIDIDHAQFLGSTVREIAAEKAGIAKARVPLVQGPVGMEAAAVISAVAGAVGAPLYCAGRDFRWQIDDRERMDFSGLGLRMSGLEVGLAGDHQYANAAVALAAMSAVRGHLPIAEGAMRDGLAHPRWPGRLQTVLERPQTILDGAHNVAAMRAVAVEIARRRRGRPLHVLFSAMGDKAWPEMVEILAPHCSAAVVSEVLPDRVAPLDRMRDAFAAHCPVEVERDPVSGLIRVRENAGADGLVLVTGSLFLVGKILEHLRVADGSGGR